MIIRSDFNVKRVFSSFFDLLPVNSSIWLSIDFLNTLAFLGIRTKSNINETFSALHQLLLEKSIQHPFILIPAFTNTFPEKKYFSTNESIPYFGAFSKYLFNLKYESRSLHPFYSFYIYGSEAEHLISSQYTDSVGTNSIFHFLNEKNFYLFSIGHHYCKALTSIHQSEFEIGVDYRKLIYFKGLLKNSYNQIQGKYSYYGRCLDRCEFSGITQPAIEMLQQQRISLSGTIENNNKRRLGWYLLNLKRTNEFVVTNHSKSTPLVDYSHPSLRPKSKLVPINLSNQLYNSLIS